MTHSLVQSPRFVHPWPERWRRKSAHVLNIHWPIIRYRSNTLCKCIVHRAKDHNAILMGSTWRLRSPVNYINLWRGSAACAKDVDVFLGRRLHNCIISLESANVALAAHESTVSWCAWAAGSLLIRVIWNTQDVNHRTRLNPWQYTFCSSRVWP
jgi:hypothetical protein